MFSASSCWGVSSVHLLFVNSYRVSFPLWIAIELVCLPQIPYHQHKHSSRLMTNACFFMDETVGN